MAEQFTPMTPSSSDITSDDKLWAMLSYLIPVIIPVLVLVMEDKKSRPFVKAHAVQALVYEVAYLIVGGILSFTIILACIPFVAYIVGIYWALKANKGEMVNIPVITNLVKSQGWA